MNYSENKVNGIKIAYIGGGSRGWAWGLMSDLVSYEDISGDVFLYDIDYEAAKDNETIGNMFNNCEGAKSVWNYHAAETAEIAMKNADFVIISILPGTFDEMESDVHAPEKYGIYQSVGDSSGPGGILRAMRAVPMFEEIAENVKKYCPDAWVINYTNPMTICVKTLYRVFPEIKAFGCCHEVFGTQKVLAQALDTVCGIKDVDRCEIKVNPVGVNHFTWVTEARYKNMDLFPVYAEFAEMYTETGFYKSIDNNWLNKVFQCKEKVKFDLFRKYDWIAAAGDRHLAEFCEGKWYLQNPEKIKNWGFEITPVSFRKQELQERLEKSRKYRTGELKLEINNTGEEGVHQMRAILGLCELVTNVNIPNNGQIPNLPQDAVVETNATFSAGKVVPVMAGNIPASIYPMVARICGQQEALNDAIAKRDVKAIRNVFLNDPLVTCAIEDAVELFSQMCENTKKYLGMYDLSTLKRG